MISDLVVKNFKCFEYLNVEMSLLNVFSGINSMGKSSAIQALLLLRQAYEMNALDKGIYLNGVLTNLGTGYELLYRNSQTDRFIIGINTDSLALTNEYKYAKNSDFQKLVANNFDIKKARNINLFGDNFSYVSAERKGPQKYYKSSYHEIFDKNKVGVQGEFWAAYIAERGMKEKVKNFSVLHKKQKSDLLIYQMEAWMSELTYEIHLTPKKYQEAGIVSLEYTVDAEPHTPMNVGFGLSYVAPIVLSVLKAKKDDLVIVENPEAHLHPRGQRVLGELIARAAAGGVQVLVETHSDHLLNGIRLAVKKNIIAKEYARLNYFFVKEVDTKELGKVMMHDKCSPMIMDDGSLPDWPEGFFDEWDKAIEELF